MASFGFQDLFSEKWRKWKIGTSCLFVSRVYKVQCFSLTGKEERKASVELREIYRYVCVWGKRKKKEEKELKRVFETHGL